MWRGGLTTMENWPNLRINSQLDLEVTFENIAVLTRQRSDEALAEMNAMIPLVDFQITT